MFKMSYEQQRYLNRELLIQNTVVGQQVFRVKPVGQGEFSHCFYGDFGEKGVKEEGIVDMQGGRHRSGAHKTVILARLKEFVVVPLKSLFPAKLPLSDIPVQSSTLSEDSMLQV
jgi:hypothetical protein